MRPQGHVSPIFHKLIVIIPTRIILDIGINQTWVDRVTADTISGMLHGNGLGQILYAGFGNTIDRHTGQPRSRQPKTYSQ